MGALDQECTLGKGTNEIAFWGLGHPIGIPSWHQSRGLFEFDHIHDSFRSATGLSEVDV